MGFSLILGTRIIAPEIRSAISFLGETLIYIVKKTRFQFTDQDSDLRSPQAFPHPPFPYQTFVLQMPWRQFGALSNAWRHWPHDLTTEPDYKSWLHITTYHTLNNYTNTTSKQQRISVSPKQLCTVFPWSALNTLKKTSCCECVSCNHPDEDDVQIVLHKSSWVNCGLKK